ncbi:ScyD/ScyE family protein [bacterium]|nr:ScyD/ScyE family protein [bacterium]
MVRKDTLQLHGFSILLAMICFVGIAFADDIPPYDYATPIFGLAAEPDGSLLVADNGAGIVELRKGEANLIAELPTVTDVSPIGRGKMFALTGIGTADESQKLFKFSHGKVTEIADLFEFETNVNPDGGVIDSNPFDVEALSASKALVADAGGNDLLIVDKKGNVDWIATLPNELVSTQDIKNLVGCPDPVPGFEWVCGLPDMLPAQAVATSVAVGPDGAYYVGELKGFPAPRGESQIWRIEPGTLHAQCGSSPACTVVADGFTSIVDLNFAQDGILYVVEIDEASWAAVEFQIGAEGGTVNSCDISTWTCTEFATGLQIPIATAADNHGTIFAAVSVLIPGLAEIIQLP